MSSPQSDVADTLKHIADRIGDEMSEKDVENAFLNEGFYSKLGYEGAGYDLRSELTLPDNRRPDYITLDTNGSVTVVYEFKAPGRDLSPHTDQLFHYTESLKADYGVLTNGESFLWYRRDDRQEMDDVSMAEATESQGRDIYAALRKPEWNLSDPEHVHEYLDDVQAEGVRLNTDLGREHFFDTFRLEEDSPFANLVLGLMDVLQELRDEQEHQFVTSAYNYWEATYASDPDEIPDSWDQFINGKQSLRDFMFCLESGHALLARLLLAKATEDHDFFSGTGYAGMHDYFWGLQDFDRQINLEAFPVASFDLIRDMRDNLVEGLFQDDIFIWWSEAFQSYLDTGHESGASRFRSIAEGESKPSQVSEPTQERLSRAIASIFFNVLRFDFAETEGDLLGDLYQRYFDPETRKALGEFYTPQPVVEYIMDGVEYNRGVSRQRLIDPACGSGTFLVEAVERFIADIEHYEEDPDWERQLKNLCAKPRIVGLDIHPFAVLMAQIRFVIAILPAYREAKTANPDFTLSRIPIYRTDTLRNERELSGLEIGDDKSVQVTLDALTEDSQDVLIPVPLPIEIEDDEGVETEEGFLVRRVRMPLFDTVQLDTGIRGFDEYFAALQGVIDTVKDHLIIQEETIIEIDWEYQRGLEDNIHGYTTQEYDGLEEFFSPYVDDMLEHVRYLKEEHDDGRLFKMLEDAVLSLVVKNYMEYDYVVGNPPYVRIQHLPDWQKSMMDSLYDSTTGNYDIYCPFYERGINWLREPNGKLGYIAPNQFMVTDYGEGLRRVMLNRTRIDEVYDFRDSGVFEDATNYPAIVILEQEDDESTRVANQIRCVRVKASTDEGDGPELDEAIIDAVRDHRDEPGYSDEYVDVFDFPQSELDSNYWALMPPSELRVFSKLETNSDAQVGEVTDAVFQGIRTSGNKIYVVDVLDAERVESDDKGGIVTVVPIGESEEYEIETDLLRPFLQGDEIKRWRGTWSGLHVIHPYFVRETKDDSLESGLYSAEHLENNLPHTWNYFLSHKDELEGRENGRKEGKDDWYGYIYPKNLERFEVPKIIQAEIAEEATYMIDWEGTWYFTTGYGLSLVDNQRGLTREITCQLNSTALDFYLKHIAAIKAGGYYSYRTQYVEKLPCIIDDEGSEFQFIRERLQDIVAMIDTESKTNRFPEAYLKEYDGEFEYITYEWQTRRYPVNATIENHSDGSFTVEAGRSDVINNPAMHADTENERRLRAEYVHAAVDGRNVKKGEEMSIPIPYRQDGVETLLETLNSDIEDLQRTNIEELEAEINSAVYNLFDLSDEDIAVIEEYLTVF